MNSPIPVISIKNFAENKEVFCVETQDDVKSIPMHLPYRTAYYGFGIIMEGSGVFNVNLETYPVERGAILAVPPDAIKKWEHRADDLKTISIFFTKNFFANYILDQHRLDNLPFFQLHTQHIVKLSPEKANIVEKLLYDIKNKINEQHSFSNEIIAHLLNIVFYEYTVLYNEMVIPHDVVLSRAAQIVMEFKKLVTQYFIKQRSVKFYAETLFITASHLSETIKTETGKSAGEWIDEAVILEAKVLLQDPDLNISQIAHQLNFSDQSTFGKFFKNICGLSPLAYRQSL
jgi:AraC family transcriptional regulator, transcriptional activator of pobA